MAGPQGNLKKGWENISSVIAQPFAYVFDKKDAPLAAAAALRSEGYREVDPDLGAVVRHHVYPRKRL